MLTSAFKLKILIGNCKIKRDNWNCAATQASLQSLLQKLNFGNSGQKLSKNLFQIFLFLPNLSLIVRT